MVEKTPDFFSKEPTIPHCPVKPPQLLEKRAILGTAQNKILT